MTFVVLLGYQPFLSRVALRKVSYLCKLSLCLKNKKFASVQFMPFQQPLCVDGKWYISGWLRSCVAVHRKPQLHEKEVFIKRVQKFLPRQEGFYIYYYNTASDSRNESSSKYIVNVTFYPFLYCFDWSHKSRFETNNSDSYTMKLVRLFFVLPFAIAFM